MSTVASRLNEANQALRTVNRKLARGIIMSPELRAEFDMAHKAAKSATQVYLSLNTPTRAEKKGIQ